MGKKVELPIFNKKDNEEKVSFPKCIYIEAVVMENGEVLHYGKSLGFICDKQMELIKAGATKIVRGNEIVIALWDNIA